MRALTDPRYRFAGDIIMTVLIALEVCLAVHTTIILIRDGTRSRKRNSFLIAFITFILALQLLGWVGWITSTEVMLVEKPGETTATENTWRNPAGLLAILLTEWLDGLLLMYRCYIMWGYNIRIIAVPILLFLAVTALGITTITQSKTSFSFTSSIFLNLWVPIAAAFLLLMTTLISYRIIAAQRAILKVGGPLTKLQINYMGIVAILVEAALPFSVLCVVLAVALARAWDCILILMAIWGCGAAIVPLLIIYRVATGTAWSNDSTWMTRNGVSDIRFQMQTFSARDTVTVPGDLRPGFDPRSEDLDDRRMSKQC